MDTNSPLDRCTIVLSLLIVNVLLIVGSGCSKDSSESKDFDSVIYVLKESVKNAEVPVDVKKHAELAISKWKNGIIDQKPILVKAVLGKPKGIDQVLLAFIIFDEDRDTVGFVIKEEYIDSNGLKTTLEEDYPAYIHCLPFEVADAHWVPVSIRDTGQQKDSQLWQEYIKTDFNELVNEYSKTDKISLEGFYPGKFWEDTLPPVWVSIPEPDKVNVWVYVYDKAGNKSEAVKLLKP